MKSTYYNNKLDAKIEYTAENPEFVRIHVALIEILYKNNLKKAVI
jgi:hypothetical protein